ncbi:GNAT family N-acetyltransferase [Fluviicola taffensis]|uniref:GCN5-related N-acetyltransferase n=1 Tax=Fluviicola taffensis (strain DSM 16823 / NCIMB 13979 / RW262) TaxID=755732 RepID=F2IC91_FLUTR|nr:GNAT family N-acetyltransferase [Fluviicola taffensis]AEA44337.1 GCN5-related N-acetyltransferase [Fluviicola taffensis DSM 16823]
MIEVKNPKTEQEWESYYDLRYRILREPLRKERGSERNDGDENGIHFALYENDQLIAVARLDAVDQTTCQARFVAVESNLQGKGYGKEIMTELENKAERLGYNKLILHARDYALPFYEKLGYTLVGPSYKLFDILQHFEMYKELTHGE